MSSLNNRLKELQSSKTNDKPQNTQKPQLNLRSVTESATPNIGVRETCYSNDKEK